MWARAGADVSALEREIDELVYALYGLTKEEVKLVEDAGRMKVPEGQTRIAQRFNFNAGLASLNSTESRRDDRKCPLKCRILFRPFGAFSLFFALPTVETAGYFFPPLRGCS